jgi:hypothetical protein
MAMAIERNNSFHLLLSDDELRLLRLLAEREGLNASDYLRSLLRQMAGLNPGTAQVLRLASLKGGNVDFAKLFGEHAASGKETKETKKAKGK